MAEADQATDRRIEKLFEIMVKKGASDLHLKHGSPPILRIGGALHNLKMDPLSDRQIRKLVYGILTQEQIATFEERLSLDVSYEFGEGHRIRMAIFMQRGKMSSACRLVKNVIPSFEELHLPPVLAKMAQWRNGLVLVVGPTGSGKSTTLAAMLQEINRSRACHILTIEDPIEYAYEDDKAIINQREIGIDVPSWEAALKAMVRADPDVVLIGEMRDPDTFWAGLTAAETGHMVFGTIHASNASQTFARILEMFPQERHQMIREQLSAHLRAVIAQMILPCAREDVRLVPAVEIMISNPMIRALIHRGEEPKIAEVISGSRDQGMQSMTQSLCDLVNRDMVLRQVALDHAPNREKLLMLLRGISTDEGAIVG